jgi:lactoylglutathione lyase
MTRRSGSTGTCSASPSAPRTAPPAAGSRSSTRDAGRATLELADPPHAAYIDDVEVGRRVAGHVRVAFGVDDSAAAAATLAEGGATIIAGPTPTPWSSVNARLEAPAGLQLTLFTDLPGSAPGR